MGEWLPLATLVIGIVGGVFLARSGDSNRRKAVDLQQQLDAANTELSDYRTRVSRHFSRTAELVDALAENSREIYNHLAEGSEKLCDVDVVKLGQFDVKPSLTTKSEPSPQAETVIPGEETTPTKPDDGWYEIMPETDEQRNEVEKPEKPEKRKAEEPAV